MVRQREKVAGMERMLRNLVGEGEPRGDPILDRLRERRDITRRERLTAIAQQLGGVSV